MSQLDIGVVWVEVEGKAFQTSVFQSQHCGRFSSIADLYLLDSNNCPPPLTYDNQMSLEWGQKSSLVENCYSKHMEKQL